MTSNKIESLYFLRMQLIFLHLLLPNTTKWLADRTVLQMAQAAPQDKEILRYYEEHCEDTNLYCHQYLSACFHHQTRYATRQEYLRNLADLEHLANSQNTLERLLRQN